MVSNQVLGARLGALGLILSLTLAGCSHLSRTHQAAGPEASVPAPVSQVPAAAAEPQMTATEAALANRGGAAT